MTHPPEIEAINKVVISACLYALGLKSTTPGKFFKDGKPLP